MAQTRPKISAQASVWNAFGCANLHKMTFYWAKWLDIFSAKRHFKVIKIFVGFANVSKINMASEKVSAKAYGNSEK